jgi:large subunit ribosomal protein L7/L12
MTTEQFADELVKLSVTELQDLVKVLKDKYGLEATQPTIVESIKEEPIVEEKTTFSVKLEKDRLDESSVKMATIRLVKEITGLVLHEAKSLVESAPVIIKENISKEEAEGIKDRLIAAQATVVLV